MEKAFQIIHQQENQVEKDNTYYMKKAIALAKKGRGYTNPNPIVGAVILKDGRMIGKGYHRAYGEAHAEVEALNDCKESSIGATLYVTLEPCSHTGKTPPCVDAIIRAGIGEVVIGMVDPNPLVSGQGIKKLESAGIKVIHGVLEDEVKALNHIFMKYISTGKPYCILKSAMTLDGKMATVTGDAKWITSQVSRHYVHELRHQMSAIMVGIGTVLADNPKLTTRLPHKKGQHPIRVILDTACRIPLDAALLHEEGRTLLIVGHDAPEGKVGYLRKTGIEVWVMDNIDRIDIAKVIGMLGDRGIDSVLIEGGSLINDSALRAGVVDEVMMFIAPKIVGGSLAKSPVGGEGIPYMKDAITLEEVEMKVLGPDILMRGRVQEG